LEFSKLNNVLKKIIIKKTNTKKVFINSAIFNLCKVKKESEINMKIGIINLKILKLLVIFSKLFDKTEVSMPIGARLKIK
tara:strand:- start:867 stop:1106 length:240 start_codon:yes stop_codon:yes gene_type:complete